MNADRSSCPTLTGLNNYEIWKLCITLKLHRKKVLGITLGTDTKPRPVSNIITLPGGMISTIISGLDSEEVQK
ncbi:hypothetical protein J3A83DRAFT_4092902 [Scleroderma citrinum]